MSDNIQFIFAGGEELYDDIEKPKPAYKFKPEWYEQLGLEESGIDTVRRCIPFLEAMTIGWIIPVPENIYIQVFNDDGEYGMRSIGESGGRRVEPHAFEQVGDQNHPMMPNPIFKFLNPWLIQTPEGYSCWFVDPINRIEERWLSYSGIVDTDDYSNLIHFPSIWLSGEYEGVIEGGTPLIQVIPFERDGLNLDGNVRGGKEHEKSEGVSVHKEIESGQGVYRDNFWKPKKQARSE